MSLCSGLAAANPVITEFMASNKATAVDEDGDFSDWIEIHNPTTAPVSLDGWYLTDTATDLKKWKFPNVTLAPGEFRLVWASGKNRRFPNQPLHANFSLSADGEYLALVQPDGTTVAQDFGAQYPAQKGDESYGGRFLRTVYIAPGANTRYRVPASASDPGATWTQTAFADGTWSVGPSGLGHGLTVPGITVRQVCKNGSIGGMGDADTLLAQPTGSSLILSETTVTEPIVNYLGEGSDGRFELNTSPPLGASDNYAIKLTGWVDIPSAGYYTFGTNSDDGVRVKIDNTTVINDDTFHGPIDNYGSRNLTAGLHTFEVVMFQGTGGDSLEFFAAPGQYTTWNANVFRLVGDTANGGLAASTLPAGSGSVFATNTQTLLDGKPGAFFRTAFSASGPGTYTAMSLVTRHNDGFAAWLNGTKVASDNVPGNPAWNSNASGARSNADSLRRMAFNVTAQLPLIASGNNVLAVHGMKNTANDPSFLILPELIAGTYIPTAAPAFYGNDRATPGWINGQPSSLGKVEDTQFSVKRGFFTAPVTVAITSPTPGVTINYTLDGSTPSATAGTTYTGPLTISSTSVLRAIATKPGWESTDVDTQTYLFLNDVITQSSTGTPPPGWPSASGTSQVLDYGMDPDIVNHSNPDIGGQASVKAAIASLPAVSITTDLPNLFNMNGSQGIYSNPNNRGFAWERPASLEWINPPNGTNPNGTSEFQVNAGLRLRGGYSRSTDNPKHSFRAFFRGEYGDSKLTYPLFGRYGAQEFDQIDFRTAQNYSWSFGGDDANTFLREESTRQAQLDMGQPGSHVRYFHLFLNGQYWGLYNLDERTEADFAESYFGGHSADYDVVKAEQTADYTVGATDGTLVAWQDLWNKAKTHRANPTNANYFRLMGRGANGVTPTADPVLLDPDNLIDYLLLTFWTGNLDGCTSAFLGNDRANNWFGSRRRDGNPGQGFRFFAHDFEHTFFNVDEDRTGPFTAPNESNFSYSNPMFLHQDLIGNAEYRMRWADRVHKQLFNNGPFTPNAWQNRINKLAGVVDDAIIAESARWGDAKVSTPKTRQTWINAQNSLLNYLPQRTSVILNQLRADGLYPTLDAPVVTPFGGYQNSGVQAVINGPASSTWYYMPDGSDPRAVGGAVKSGALTYTSATTSEDLIPMSASGWKYLSDGSNQGTTWRAAAFSDASWSTGTAELGYGDGDETTIIPITEVSPGQKTATSYFRRAFSVTNPGQITNLNVTVEYDDAYAVYLNGTRIAGNLPVDPAYNYYAGNNIEDTLATTQVNPALLLAGNNVIAVEIHQSAPTSSDISMNLSLTATRSSTPTPLFLTGTGERKLRARALSGATWSAMTEATFLLDTDPASPSNLAISEIHYHPADPSPSEITAGFEDGSDFEFVELLNTSNRYVDLDGVYFYGAVSFNFTGAATGRTLAPGARVLVVGNLDAFQHRYGNNLPVAGHYSGKLDNAGENLILYTPGDSVIRSVNYDDASPWPTAADGTGVSLVRRHPTEPAGDNDPEGWAVSGAIGGSPGTADVFAPGTFDAWTTATFTPAQLAASATSGPSADPDGDGRSNVEEYAFATQPLVPDQPDVIFTWSTVAAAKHAAVRIRRPTTATDVLYELLANDSLQGEWTVIGSTAAETTPLGSGIEHAVFRDATPATGAKRFLRVRATWKP
ncbi:lamin tail domain-containing protein [Luteolibacter soli]|uniref:lamin tail domain-containing protein n=1 Tax=Luteolibacter soli TaxID=3135280 RepID=UPI00311A2DAC